jgi:hypothetical protein
VSARKKDTKSWSVSKWVEVDCRKPNIIEPTFKAINETCGKLTFKSDQDVYYQLKGPTFDTGKYGPLLANTLNEFNITVPKNTTEVYTLTLYRYTNTDISNSIQLRCNTITPKLSIQSTTFIGNRLRVIVNADVNCVDWSITIKDSNGNIIGSKNCPSSQDKNKLDVTIDGFSYNETYSIDG